jgi:hypothetical protein
MTDQLALIQDRLNYNGYFNCKGQAYAISGDLVIPDGAELCNGELIQLDQCSNRRSITKTGGKNARIDRMKIYRGDDLRKGTITDSAGIWLYGVTGLTMNEVTVYGNGPGTGMRLISCNDSEFNALTAQDMRFAADSNPGTEQLVGIWFDGCRNFSLNRPVARRIDGTINGDTRPYQTDGIDFSGCRDFTVVGPQASFCGEGIDASGGDGNRAFTIIGGNITDCDSFGIKLANSASQGRVIGSTATRCGLGGFVVSGPTAPNLPRCERNAIVDCDSLETGSNGRWAAYNVTGFAVLSSGVDSSLPESIVFERCNAIDGQSIKTMKYGFRNENNNLRNKLVNCTSVGHSIQSTLGTFG